jgi:hypothetical protein
MAVTYMSLGALAIGNCRLELRTHFVKTLVPMILWCYTPAPRTAWRNKIARERGYIDALVYQVPRLRESVAQALADAYPIARLRASFVLRCNESMLPAACPWSVFQVRHHEYFPEPWALYEH